MAIEPGGPGRERDRSGAGGPRLLVVADLGGPATFHAGDEAMAAADVALLRRLLPGVRLTLVSSDPVHTAAAYGCAAVAPVGFAACEDEAARRALLDATPSAAALTAAAAADAVVLAGGGNLSAAWPEHLYERLAVARAAARAGTPLIVLGQSLGPQLDPRQAVTLAEILRSALLVGLRDMSSAALALRLGVEPGRVLVQADDALLLPARRPAAIPSGLDPERPWVAVTVHPFGPVDDPAVQALAAQLGDAATAHGASLVLVPHAFEHVGSDGASDLDMAAALAGATGGTVLRPGDAGEAVWAAQAASAVVSTRYHPLVFAGPGAVPALALPSDDYTAAKALGALAVTGTAQWALGLPAAIAGALRPALAEVLDRRAELSAWLAAQRPVLERTDARRVAALVRALAEAGLDPAAAEPVPAPPAAVVGAPRPRGAWATPSDPDSDPLCRQFWSGAEAAEADRRAERVHVERAAAETAAYVRSLEDARRRAEEYALTLEESRAIAERHAVELTARLAACTGPDAAGAAAAL